MSTTSPPCSQIGRIIDAALSVSSWSTASSLTAACFQLLEIFPALLVKPLGDIDFRLQEFFLALPRFGQLPRSRRLVLMLNDEIRVVPPPFIRRCSAALVARLRFADERNVNHGFLLGFVRFLSENWAQNEPTPANSIEEFLLIFMALFGWRCTVSRQRLVNHPTRHTASRIEARWGAMAQSNL
jgi:hypothetical protein